jgi:hypothetical protein
LRQRAGIIRALALAAGLAHCGGPAKLPVCETVARQTVTAPKPENVRADPIVDRRLRIHFTIPKFDEACKVPLLVRVLGTLWTGEGEGLVYGQPSRTQSQDAPLPPFGETGMEVWGPGDTSIDAEIPAGTRVVSFRLEVTDDQGERFVTPPVVIE